MAVRKRTTCKRIVMTIRAPEELVALIDQACDLRQVPLSRNNWLLEAVVEKLARSDDRGKGA